MARADHRPDGAIVDEPNVIQGGVRMRKGAEESPTLEGIHLKVDELNNHVLPEGVKVIPMLDRSDLLHYTLHTVLHIFYAGQHAHRFERDDYMDRLRGTGSSERGFDPFAAGKG